MDIRGRKMKKPPACVQCRRRKVGCDRVKPVCGNCRKNTKNTEPCFYPAIPGQFTPSHSGSSSHTKKDNLNQSIQFIQQRESMVFSPQYNPELASLEQIREYNTRLQLLNNNNNSNAINDGPSQNINAKFMPRTKNLTKFFENKKVSSANKKNDDEQLNWIQGPAIFNLNNEIYNKDKNLINEMDFLKLRLLELQDITGIKASTKLNIDNTTSNNNDNDYNINLNLQDNPFRNILKKKIKKRKSIEKANLKNKHRRSKIDSNDKDNEEDIAVGDADPEEEDDDNVENNAQDNNKNQHHHHHHDEDIDEDTTNALDDNSIIGDDDLSKFLVMDPDFINSNEIFDILNPAYEFKSEFKNYKSNNLFDLKFLVKRDPYLFNYYENLNNIIMKNFEIQYARVNDEKLNAVLRENHKFDYLNLSFPSRSITLKILKIFVTTISESNNLIPISKPTDFFLFIEQLFGKEPIFQISKLNLNQIIILGNISIFCLLTFESLNSTVLIPLKDEISEIYVQLKNWQDQLNWNLHLVTLEINKKNSIISTNLTTGSNLEILKFFSLLKFYKSIRSSFYNNPDLDEDIHLARKFAINMENKNQFSILLWNFIYKNYSWRHFFKGEIPSLTLTTQLNSNFIIDPLLNMDYQILQFQNEFLMLLHTNDHLLSLKQVEKFRKIYKEKMNESKNNKLSTLSSTIHSIVDALIYRNSMLFWNYFLLLQYEKTDNLEAFNEIYKEYLQLIQETLFYVFSNLASLKFAGYEFIFANKSFLTLSNTTQIILALYSRCHLIVKDYKHDYNNPNNTLNDNFKFQVLQQSKFLTLLLQKILMLLNDYSKNCKMISPLLRNLCTRITTQLEFIELCESNNEFSSSIYQFLPEGHKNAFEKMDISFLVRYVSKLRIISESLIKTDFYQRREPYRASNISTMGVTKDTFRDVYSSYYS